MITLATTGKPIFSSAREVAAILNTLRKRSGTFVTKVESTIRMPSSERALP
jgi:hypothetical protein